MIRVSGIMLLIGTIFTFSLLTGCNMTVKSQKIEKVGMLIENSINDQTWGNKGYRGLLELKEEHDVDVYFREEVKTRQQTKRVIEEFANNGVDLIIGHSSIYGKFFQQIHTFYPDIHFLYVNGGYSGDNLTSLNFNSMPMGFFAGMMAGKMTETNKVGIIAAYEWQPEVEGFYEGVQYQNDQVNVDIKYVYSWDNEEVAMQHYNAMIANNVDTIYPAGDAYSIPIIESAMEQGIQSIGFVNDQSNIGGQSVLTSTVQHVDKLYVYAFEQIENGEIIGGVYNFGFPEEVISMGSFSDQVPEPFIRTLKEDIDEYKTTGLLPHQQETK
ncbi:BMP family ABC transporter substrate-binding protein [Gracilibacillus sp. YIM 98692]|uniref:BMP family ABC transporter substrate-binding protein n=1 Tax=Gracilibacillus sp. YIM 98692 TaxID=2663532 RepID=UPI001F08B05F|nr:BMP family ABC transporter substrate-binding protein [Gracilibacillus sp. YIM 98692]